jgi:hypothetical protein
VDTAWARLRIRVAVIVLLLATATAQIVSAMPAGSYQIPVVGPGFDVMTTGSWASGVAVNRTPITIGGDRIRISRSLATIRIRFSAYVSDATDGGPAPGVTVIFTAALAAGGSIACTATTDQIGTVGCTTRAVPGITLADAPTYRIVARQSARYFAADGIGRITWWR